MPDIGAMLHMYTLTPGERHGLGLSWVIPYIHHRTDSVALWLIPSLTAA